jgi:hypothetical protein
MYIGKTKYGSEKVEKMLSGLWILIGHRFVMMLMILTDFKPGGFGLFIYSYALALVVSNWSSVK